MKASRIADGRYLVCDNPDDKRLISVVMWTGDYRRKGWDASVHVAGHAPFYICGVPDGPSESEAERLTKHVLEHYEKFGRGICLPDLREMQEMSRGKW